MDPPPHLSCPSLEIRHLCHVRRKDRSGFQPRGVYRRCEAVPRISSSGKDTTIVVSTTSWYRARKLNNPYIRWLRVPFTSNKTPLPPAKSLDDSLLIPEATANFFSLVTFQWITPLLDLGYARPLEAPDLWKLQKDRGAAIVADKITASFTRRLKEADEYNQKLANGEIKPGLKGVWWSIRGNRAAKELEWRQKTGRKKASLVWALNDSVAWWFWSAGLLKVVGDTAQVTSPLVVKVRQLINYHCFLSKIQLISRPLSSSQRNRIVGTDWIHPSQQLGSVSALHSPFSPCS